MLGNLTIINLAALFSIDTLKKEKASLQSRYAYPNQMQPKHYNLTQNPNNTTNLFISVILRHTKAMTCFKHDQLTNNTVPIILQRYFNRQTYTMDTYRHIHADSSAHLFFLAWLLRIVCFSSYGRWRCITFDIATLKLLLYLSMPLFAKSFKFCFDVNWLLQQFCPIVFIGVRQNIFICLKHNQNYR